MSSIDLSKAKILPKKLRLVFLMDARLPENISAEIVKKINPDDGKRHLENSLLRADLVVVGKTGLNERSLSKQLVQLTHEAGCVWLEAPNDKLTNELEKTGFNIIGQQLFQKKSGTTPEEYGKSYIARWGDTDWLQNARLAAAQILEHAPQKFNKKTSKILDVGCLNGYIMESLCREGLKEIYGNDISYFLAVEKQINPWFLPAITVCDFTHNDYPSRVFDMTICMEVLEHLPPELTHKFIAELARVTSEKGALLISTSEDWAADETHINCRNRAEWYWEFAKVGLVPQGQQIIFPGFNSFVLRHAHSPVEKLSSRFASAIRLLTRGKLSKPPAKQIKSLKKSK